MSPDGRAAVERSDFNHARTIRSSSNDVDATAMLFK